MLRHLVLAGALAGALPLLPAQSPLTTLYAGGNGLGANSTIYFDLQLNAPLVFTQLDVNCSSGVNTAGSIEVRWTTGTYVGNDTNAGAWTLGATATLVSAGNNQPTSCSLTPFALPAGNYGFAVTFLGVGQSYTNGNGTSTPGTGTNQTYSTNELTLLAGGSAGGPPGTAIVNTPRVFNGAIHYQSGGGGTIAQRSTYGTGCYRRLSSFYELFSSSAAFDLSNTAISMLPTGNGYTVLPGITAYVPPSAGATTLTMTDDSQVTVALAVPFPYAGGVTSSLVVCSNGFVSVATGNGTTYTPVVNTMLNAPQTAWWNWHDYNPGSTSAGAGRVKTEVIGTITYITWDGVYDLGGTSAANANTFQFQFDSGTGIVHLVFQTMSALGNARLVGYSPGGSSTDPGPLDLSAAVPTTFTVGSTDQQPLALAASARPILGTTVNLLTSNPTVAGLGVNFLGFAQIPAPGFDLAVIGAPGCPALLDVNQAVGNVIGNAVPGLSMSIALPIPNNTALNGLPLFSQSIWLDAAANTFGMLTSNGVALVLGNL
jgi:hypothetical protein